MELANFEFSSNGVIDVARTTSDLPTTLPVDIPGVLDPDTNRVTMVHCEALIDSGASHSLIDPQLAERLIISLYPFQPSTYPPYMEDKF